jgi:hypothetical protein
MMTGTEFAQKCKRIATDYLTAYIWGAVGMPIGENTLADRCAAYPKNVQKGWADKARALIGKRSAEGHPPFMFDCVCLIKAVLWGWRGDPDAWFGGAVYASNGVPDVSADEMIRLCRNVSTDFRAITPGEALWTPGHIGVYLGDGLAVECTPAFAGGVQITGVSNIGTRANYANRRWQKHGKIPWVSYVYDEREERANGTIIVDGIEHPISRILEGGRNYFQLRELAAILGDGWKYEISNIGSTAVLSRRKER